MIHLIYTGGTVGMVRRADGALEPAGIEGLLTHVPELRTLAACDYYTLEPPRDSVDIGPPDWLRLARYIGRRYLNYDGFVILHGTDTMVYTAAALAFLLEGLRKPVILTGAQLPIGDIRSDARNNLITAVELAACGHPQTREVAIYFHDRLMRGTRTVKTSISAFDAFASPDCPPLAQVGTDITFPPVPPLPPGPVTLTVHRRLNSNVALVKLFPGLTPELLQHLVGAPVQGVVLETFGSGNIPATPGLVEVLATAIRERDLPVVAITQQLQGRVRLEHYAAGRRLLEAGVVSGGDMTSSAALVKLMYLLGQDMSPQRRRELLAANLRGELSEEPA
ncbi:MAG: asparaginase [Caldilineae bacterium]|nr:MAG: asparaginase [Caldilineae bacterium]